MNVLGTILFLANSIVFLAVGHIFLVRLREAKGSLRLAKICIAMSTFSAAGAFQLLAISQLVYDQYSSQSWLLIAGSYVSQNLLAMLVLAFLASFAVFATYSGGGRKLIIVLIFAVALMPTAYLALAWDQITVTPGMGDTPESYYLDLPQYAFPLFALCGIPLGAIPVAAFGKSLIIALKRGDRVLSNRGAMMFSSVVLNMVTYLVFVFPAGILRFIALAAWIPVELFVLFAVLKITSPIESKMRA